MLPGYQAAKPVREMVDLFDQWEVKGTALYKSGIVE